MKFWRKPNGEYYALDMNQMHAVLISGAHMPIDENSEEWMNGTIHEFDSWNHMFEVTHFNPLKTDRCTGVMWISPTGERYSCDCHAEMAMWICQLVFDLPDDLDFEQYNTALEAAGWIKVSNWMWTFYSEYEFRLTQPQYDALWEWCHEMHEDMPESAYVTDFATGTHQF